MTTERINVRAALEAFGEDYRMYIPQFHAQNRKRMKKLLSEFDQARAAVAELIEADREFDAAQEIAWQIRHNPNIYDAVARAANVERRLQAGNRRAAALARMEPQS